MREIEGRQRGREREKAERKMDREREREDRKNDRGQKITNRPLARQTNTQRLRSEASKHSESIYTNTLLDT